MRSPNHAAKPGAPGGDNFKKNHPNTGESPSKIDRNEFKKTRMLYWKSRI